MTDEEFLDAAEVIAGVRQQTLTSLSARVQEEMRRHDDTLERIRSSRSETNRALAGVLEEAAQRRIPQSVLSSRLKLSRQRLHRIRQSATQRGDT